ncbi:MAG: ERG2 family protein [Polyangiales bacterium]
MPYLFDAHTLQRDVQDLIGTPRSEVFQAVTERLHSRYPDVISPTLPPWLLNNAGGAMGQFMLLYASLQEYIMIFGTPIGTEGHSGRYATQIWDLVLDGEMWCYREGETERHVYGPGDMAYLGCHEAKGYRIPEQAWMLEYCRGNVPSMLPFGLADVVSSTLDVRLGARTIGYYGSRVLRAYGQQLRCLVGGRRQATAQPQSVVANPVQEAARPPSARAHL